MSVAAASNAVYAAASDADAAADAVADDAAELAVEWLADSGPNRIEDGEACGMDGRLWCEELISWIQRSRAINCNSSTVLTRGESDSGLDKFKLSR